MAQGATTLAEWLYMQVWSRVFCSYRTRTFGVPCRRYTPSRCHSGTTRKHWRSQIEAQPKHHRKKSNRRTPGRWAAIVRPQSRRSLFVMHAEIAKIAMNKYEHTMNRTELMKDSGHGSHGHCPEGVMTRTSRTLQTRYTHSW